MLDLVAGANISLTGSAWTISLKFSAAIQKEVGIAVLPVNEATQLVAAPHFAHAAKSAWGDAHWQADGKACELSLNVSHLPNTQISRLLVVAYRYSARGSVSSINTMELQLETICRYPLNLHSIEAAAIIIGEIYQRADTWKFRALAESSAYGLAVLGHRLGMELDDSSPFAEKVSEPVPERWSGTAFLVAPGIFISNAHVIDGARRIQLNSMEGTISAEVMVQDNNNDLALLRAPVPNPVRAVSFRQKAAALAEPVTTLGYPLASVMGNSIQVTQGVISGLFGMQNDIRLLQFTAPIQPGSSGSPLLDEHGAVLGVVSASFTQTQNMNFAVRSLLVMALLDSVNVSYQTHTATESITVPEMVQQLQKAIWKVECLG